jgi:hypothetical protein
VSTKQHGDAPVGHRDLSVCCRLGSLGKKKSEICAFGIYQGMLYRTTSVRRVRGAGEGPHSIPPDTQRPGWPFRIIPPGGKEDQIFKPSYWPFFFTVPEVGDRVWS